MNDLEMNAHAEGILTYLKSKTESPREALAIIGMSLCILYDSNVDPSDLSFTQFAKDFHDCLIATEADKSHTGSATVQ